jgi:hypothetical protein
MEDALLPCSRETIRRLNCCVLWSRPANDVEDKMNQRLDYLTHFADFHEQYLARNIQLADSKAGVIATAVAGTIGLLLSQAQFRTALRAAAFSADWWLSGATVAALGFAFLLAFFVIAPRSAKSKDHPVDFEQVAEFPDARAFLADLQLRGADGVTECRIANCFDIARVCVQKYAFLRRALSFAAIGVMLTAIGFIRFGS